MKRTNLVLREDLLKEAVVLSGEKTYSRAVEVALTDFVRRAKARTILGLRGSGLWEGNLPEMRRAHGTSRSAPRVTLVDTSVWIEVFRKVKPLDPETYVAFDDIVTCLPVIQEVLQGFRDERAYRVAREAMFSLPLVESPMPLRSDRGGGGSPRAARRQGATVRSSIDCVIAACAIRHDLEVLHRDRDFRGLARVSALRERSL